MSHTPDVFAVGGETITICESNRLTVFVRKQDMDGLADLENILVSLLRQDINAVLHYLPPRIQADYGWAVYRNGIEWLSREELMLRGVKLAPVEKYERDERTA